MFRLFYLWFFLLVGCGHSQISEMGEANRVDYQNAQQIEEIPPEALMSQPANEHCVKQAGRVSFARTLDGAAVGLCQLSNGKRCEEKTLLRGVCTT